MSTHAPARAHTWRHGHFAIEQAATPATQRARQPRRGPRWLTGAGMLMVVLAVLFYFVGEPALVRLPLSVDQTVHYTGSFEEYVNPTTLAVLATPVRVPMTVSRTVRVRSGNFSTAVVTEDDTIRPGPLVYHQDFQYLINRRGMDFENSSKTMMFGQPAKVDIAGTYRVNFPLDTSASGTYRVLNTETDKAPSLSHGTALHSLKGISGVKVIDFSNTVKGPVSRYYHKWLIDNGFPSSMAPAQLEPRLQALGVNLPNLLSTLLPQLTASQRALVTQVLSTPVTLDYSYFYSGVVAVEPHTGALIWVDTTAEGLKVSPSLSGLARLGPLLAQYASVPGVQTLRNALDTIGSAPPQTVVSYNYVQTRASSQSMANFAESQIRKMELVGAVPWVLGAVGVVLAAVGIVVGRRRQKGFAESGERRRRGDDTAGASGIEMSNEVRWS